MDHGDGKGRTFTITKTGTLPTLEKLLTEMANLETEAAALEQRKKEVADLVAENAKLKAKNYFLERENRTLKEVDKDLAHSSRSFEFPFQTGSSDVDFVVLSRRHAAHEDDRVIVKIVTCFIFMFLPILIGVGVWAACLLNESKLWYEINVSSPIKLPFWYLSGVWCLIYGTVGAALYAAWYNMGGRRGVPYIVLGVVILLVSYSYPPVLLVGNWYLPSFAIACVLWVLLLLCIMCYARVSVVSGISILPCLIWTTYTAMFTYFPFYDKYFGT